MLCIQYCLSQSLHMDSYLPVRINSFSVFIHLCVIFQILQAVLITVTPESIFILYQMNLHIRVRQYFVDITCFQSKPVRRFHVLKHADGPYLQFYIPAHTNRKCKRFFFRIDLLYHRFSTAAELHFIQERIIGL